MCNKTLRQYPPLDALRRCDVQQNPQDLGGQDLSCECIARHPKPCCDASEPLARSATKQAHGLQQTRILPCPFSSFLEHGHSHSRPWCLLRCATKPHPQRLCTGFKAWHGQRSATEPEISRGMRATPLFSQSESPLALTMIRNKSQCISWNTHD